MAGWSQPVNGATMRWILTARQRSSLLSAALRSAPWPASKKRPALRSKQGMWALIGEAGQVLKRGHELPGVLSPLERKLVKLVD